MTYQLQRGNVLLDLAHQDTVLDKIARDCIIDQHAAVLDDPVSFVTDGLDVFGNTLQPRRGLVRFTEGHPTKQSNVFFYNHLIQRVTSLAMESSFSLHAVARFNSPGPDPVSSLQVPFNYEEDLQRCPPSSSYFHACINHGLIPDPRALEAVIMLYSQRHIYKDFNTQAMLDDLAVEYPTAFLEDRTALVPEAGATDPNSASGSGDPYRAATMPSL